ncbi:hypothetical protein [Yoonia litorea]|uniref:Sugar transporter n=1 Tax=Yoonia litorea TaxID=1123755 RepID=A0A1I6MJK9_9RHOB|nr:hypothetical protein [Yoonia litorea]SFS15798.1 hypothetical protein SAMN05444714_1909 [Yoonia litorea]
MTKTPMHLWIVGVLSLVWNAGGAVDYLMTKLEVPDYVAALPEDSLRLLQEAPLWFHVAWATGVWLSVVGSILLLARSRLAGTAFALSLGGLLASSVYTYGLSEGGSMMATGGPAAIAFLIAIPVLLVLQWLYARAMTRKGVLR